MTPDVAWKALINQLPLEYRIALDDWERVYTREKKCMEEIADTESEAKEWLIIQIQGMSEETNPLTGKKHSATSAEKAAKNSPEYKEFKDRIKFLRGEEGACQIEAKKKHLILQFLAR